MSIHKLDYLVVVSQDGRITHTSSERLVVDLVLSIKVYQTREHIRRCRKYRWGMSHLDRLSKKISGCITVILHYIYQAMFKKLFESDVNFIRLQGITLTLTQGTIKVLTRCLKFNKSYHRNTGKQVMSIGGIFINHLMNGRVVFNIVNN